MDPSSGKSTRRRFEICSGLHDLAQRRSARRPWRRPMNPPSGPGTSSPSGLAIMPARRSCTYSRSAASAASLDTLGRLFDPGAPDRTWFADISYIPTREGWLYLAAVMDGYSRRVVGWAMAEHLRAELAVDALQMALQRRQPAAGLICHSDRGSQGEFNRSSQHLDGEELRWQQAGVGQLTGRDAPGCVPLGVRR